MTHSIEPRPDPAGRVVIIGGGASGVLAAARLLRSPEAPREVVLVEREPKPARGTAYSTIHDEHVLNVPASRMSAFPEEPDHFVRWLRSARPETAADTYPPRAVYGRYLDDVLDEAGKRFTPSRLRLVRGDTRSIGVTDDWIEVTIDTKKIRAEGVVLALGNLPTRSPFPLDLPTERVLTDPWRHGIFDEIGRDDDIVIAGTGLTMIDIVLLLTARGHRGAIHAVSRHGLVPHAHPDVRKEWDFAVDGGKPGPISLRELVGRVRAESERATTAGASWHDVTDTLRPVIADIWQRLSAGDRSRFLRHVRAYWDIHRHRMAPAVAERFDSLRYAGKVIVHAGRLLSVKADDDTLRVDVRRRNDGSLLTLRGGWAINATGPSSDWSSHNSPLVQSLLDSGAARLDPLGLGLDATPDGVLLDRAGNPQPRIRLIGPPMRGVLWETTAIPDIREQARALGEAYPLQAEAAAVSNEA